MYTAGPEAPGCSSLLRMENAGQNGEAEQGLCLVSSSEAQLSLQSAAWECLCCAARQADNTKSSWCHVHAQGCDKQAACCEALAPLAGHQPTIQVKLMDQPLFAPPGAWSRLPHWHSDDTCQQHVLDNWNVLQH